MRRIKMLIACFVVLTLISNGEFTINTAGIDDVEQGFWDQVRIMDANHLAFLEHVYRTGESFVMWPDSPILDRNYPDYLQQFIIRY